MDYVPYYVPTNFCCLVVSKTKNDMAILQQEIEKLVSLEEECNKKLDEFYASKQEFEFMLRNLANKILGVEADDYTKEKQIIDEFTEYVMSVWQFGADKLGQAQKKLQYISIVDGLPLSVYIQAMQNSIEKGSMSIAQTVCHPYCTSLFYSMYTEITGDLFVRLSTADICFRQYEYLKKSLPFLTKLKEFINKYMEKETICSIKLFSDEIISGISLNLLGDENYDDKENLGAFRYVVNLLTGQLFGHENILDPHTEIVPIFCDIIQQRPGKKVIVNRLVNFFLKDELEFLNGCYEKNYKNEKNKIVCNATNSNNLYPLSLIENERFNQIIDPMSAYMNMSDPIIDMNGTLYQIRDSSGTSFYDSPSSIYDPFQPTYVNQTSLGTYLTTYDVNSLMPRYYETQGKTNKYNTTPGKRGRKANSTLESSLDLSCDLKPIKIPKLKQDLIKPLT